MITALTVSEVTEAICCAATRVSKLALFHFPCRCSVTTSIFMIPVSRKASPLIPSRKAPVCHPERSQGSQLPNYLDHAFSRDSSANLVGLFQNDNYPTSFS